MLDEMMERDIVVPARLLSSTRIGGIVTFLTDDGAEYRGRVLRVENENAVIRAFEKLNFPTESPLHLTLAQALPNREKMSFIMQKAVELGVNRIIPCHSAKSVSHHLPGKGTGQVAPMAGHCAQERWSSAEDVSCRRSRRSATSSQIMQSLGNEDGLKIILYERESARRLKDLASEAGGRPCRVAVFCGPEGGFTEEEIIHAERNGFVPVRLGGRMLRCETAAIAAISIIQHVWGDL